MADIIAFTTEQVARITGLSVRQLSYWDRNPRFFSPEYADQDGNRYFGRIYSFRDVVSLRTIAILRKKYEVPLQELRRVDPWLKEHHETPWASLRLFVLGQHIYFEHPSTGQVVTARYPHQTVIPVEIAEIVRDVRRVSDQLRERTPDQIGKVVRNRYIAHNAPVIAGTRIPVTAILDFHRAGYSAEEIIRQYPRLTLMDVDAAIRFAAERQNKQAS